MITVMMRSVQLTMAFAVAMIASAGHAQASIVITYQDVGSNLQFDYSGSLNVATSSSVATGSFVDLTAQGNSPVFYSSVSSFGYAGSDFSVTHTPGAFATNLQQNLYLGTNSGTSFMFRLNNPGPASSVDLWGNWGTANAPINGQLVLFGRSAASVGMVDGWTLQTDWGSITFQEADIAEVPEPATLAIWALGAVGCAVTASRRRKAV